MRINYQFLRVTQVNSYLYKECVNRTIQRTIIYFLGSAFKHDNGFYHS